MKLMLTSFGVAKLTREKYGYPDVPRHRGVIEPPTRAGPSASETFYRMPPVDMHQIVHEFVPEYWLLVLCDKLVVDEGTFETLRERPHWLYAQVAELLIQLYEEGFVELVDYGRLIEPREDLLAAMIRSDLQTPERWLEPMKASLKTWARFEELTQQMLREGPQGREPLGGVLTALPAAESSKSMLDSILRSTKLRDLGARWRLREVLPSYLAYINANIVLSNELQVGFHDWADFLPFYREKFISMGQHEVGHERSREASRQLFAVSFPEFAPSSPKHLLKVLKDKRVEELRRLVQDAAEGRVRFDDTFAKSVMREVIITEQRIQRYRHIITYATIPLSFVPLVGTAAQLLAEETLGTLVESKLKAPYSWFYMLSDVSRSAR